MKYWLMKTEPSTYSWNDLVRDTEQKGGEEWDGVRNYQARNTMQNMQVGDLVFLYHSVKEKAIQGIARVVAGAHPDSTDDGVVWQCVDIAAKQHLSNPVSLSDIKANVVLADMVLVKNSRLSVQPVTKKEWDIIVKMSR